MPLINDVPVYHALAERSARTGEPPVKKRQLWVGKSPIAGRGLFTAHVITRGTWLIRYTDEKSPKAESAKRLVQGNADIFHLNECYNIDGKACSNTARYIHHSCDPNCAAHLTTRTIWIVAQRDIATGEERPRSGDRPLGLHETPEKTANQRRYRLK